MAKGGQRYGAGRPGWRRKAESCLRIDVRALARQQLLDSGRINWGWRNTRTGESTGSVSLNLGSGSMELSYCRGGESKTQRILLERTPCPFGGSRPWFRCGGCDRRVAVLFFSGNGFGCRTCGRVAYSCQSEDGIDRTWRRQHKLESRLAENWARPHGMRLATYDRILAGIDACEERRDASLYAYMVRHGMSGALG